MAITTHLDIVSAEKAIFSGLVEMVVATGELGEIGVMPGHNPLLSVLKPGEVRATKPGGDIEIFYISGGMLEVQPHCITVLADSADRAEHLDEQAAIAAKKRAEDAIANDDKDIEYSVAASELARAAAQIKAIQKFRKHLK